MYRRYLNLKERAEAYEHLKEICKKKDIDPMRDWKNINCTVKIERMARWADKTIAKAERLKAQENIIDRGYDRGYNR